jgi:hypothetical protein
MPEQNEQTCERCGAPWTWDGETRDNVCGSCRSEDAAAYADHLRELDYFESQEGLV